MRADKFFSEKFGSRTKAAEAIEKGWVLVNGKTIRAKDEVKDIDEIVFVETQMLKMDGWGHLQKNLNLILDSNLKQRG